MAGKRTSSGGLILSIAARNVARHKKRTAITAVVMVFGIAMFALADGLLKGMDRVTIDTMTSMTTSYLKVQTAGYLEEEMALPLDFGISDPGAMAGAVKAADPAVIAVAPRMRFQAMVSNLVDELPAIAVAVDPSLDTTVFASADYVRGAWLSGSAGEALLGAELARELGLEAGEGFVLESRTAELRGEGGELVAEAGSNAASFTVVGVIDSPDPQLNKQAVYLSLRDAWNLTMADGLVTELCVRLPRSASLQADIEESSALAAKLSAGNPGYAFSPIKTLAGDYLAMRDTKSKGSFVIIFVILVIAGVGIVNTVLMSMYSRIREIGVLRAYGLTAKQIGRVFLAEGAVMGAIGSVLGAAVGALATWYMVEVGIPFGALLGKIDLGNLPLSGSLKAEWSPATFATAIAFGMVVAIVASWVPACKAKKLAPADALKFV
jgi:putative ABC transport system permease protein